MDTDLSTLSCSAFQALRRDCVRVWFSLLEPAPRHSLRGGGPISGQRLQADLGILDEQWQSMRWYAPEWAFRVDMPCRILSRRSVHHYGWGLPQLRAVV